jgi:hypothetical protein
MSSKWSPSPAPLRKNRAVTPYRSRTTSDTVHLWSQQTQTAFSSVLTCRNFCHSRQCRMRLVLSLFTCVLCVLIHRHTFYFCLHICFKNKANVIKKTENSCVSAKNRTTISRSSNTKTSHYTKLTRLNSSSGSTTTSNRTTTIIIIL